MRLFVLVLFLTSGKLSAQVISGARFMAMANADVALESTHSLGGNPAGITSMPTSVIGFSFKEHYIPSNTQSLAVMAAISTKLGGFGLYVGRYSFKNSFKESRGGLTYARMLKNKLAFAATINYHEQAVAGYSNDRGVSMDIGLQYRFSEDWLWGIHFANSYPLIFENREDPFIPTTVKLGTSYLFSKQVLLALESEFSFYRYSDFRLGLEYMFVDSLYLRGGTSVNPLIQYAGAGVSLQKINVDAAASFHPQLGISSQLSVSYAF